MSDMVTGNLRIMGKITVKELADEDVTHPMALLIVFDNVADMRKAIADGQCKYTFGREAPK